MNLSFTDNQTRNLIDVLKPRLSSGKVLRFGVAFAKYSGFSMIEDALNECLKNGGEIDFLLGLDFRTTEPKVLRVLHNLKSKGSKVSFFCFSDPSTSDMPVYHPKIYLISGKRDALISVGSSNLTAGGLRTNAEVNVIIEADLREEIVSDIHGIYNRYKFQKDRFEPDINYIEAYEETYEILRKKSAEALREKFTKSKIIELKEKERDLPRPKLTKTELWGWQKLIYEKLPERIFQTSELYAYEKEFQQNYPENRYVRDKIRQVLQQLRDLGLLKHVGRSKWQSV